MSNEVSPIESVMADVLAPAGLGESHLSRTLGSILRGGVDYADLYFQVSRQESWALEDGIIREGSFSVDQGVGDQDHRSGAPERAERPAARGGHGRARVRRCLHCLCRTRIQGHAIVRRAAHDAEDGAEAGRPDPDPHEARDRHQRDQGRPG